MPHKQVLTTTTTLGMPNSIQTIPDPYQFPTSAYSYSQSQLTTLNNSLVMGAGCLGEITVWEEQWGNEGPDVQRGGDPLCADAHPNGCPSNIHQL